MDEKNSDREPTVSRRGVLAATGTATVAVVAGCSGGGDGTATPSVPGTASSDIEELAIVDHQPDIDAAHQGFGVELTLENNGDQQIDILDYNYDLTPYNDDDSDMSGATSGSNPPENGADTGISPGGRGSVIAWSSVGSAPNRVARYEVTLKCKFAGTAYCE